MQTGVHLTQDDPGFAAPLRSLNRRVTPAPHIAEAVAAIIAEVRATGDTALWALNARFGGPAHSLGASLRVTADAFTAAARTQHAMAASHENIRAFQAASQAKASRSNSAGSSVVSVRSSLGLRNTGSMFMLRLLPKPAYFGYPQ